MKIYHRAIFGLVIIVLIFVSFQSVVSAESLKQSSNIYKREVSESSIFNSYNLEIDEHISLWYPGFLLVQLVKGVMAFIIVLLILLDIIEPT